VLFVNVSLLGQGLVLFVHVSPFGQETCRALLVNG
jgi:hypothetical protein